MPTIYFLCYGNICRSPFAEYFARSQAASLDLSAWKFDSGGVGATAGLPCPKPAIVAADELQVDLRAHRAKHLSALAPTPEDLLIAMDRHVFGSVAQHLGGSAETTLGPGNARLRLMLQDLEASPTGGPPLLDVPDPMGLGVVAYRASYALLQRAVLSLLHRLRAAEGSVW